ncbi:magnesium transporter [Mycobacterium marinum]|uniref:magnesium transporter CorA family protein n=1 Tax=Mycobacterium marinum TaxID=1781 RepID=UPI000E3C9AB4|nr:magnesium transporter CorA family protein [Mycobacterium marinum]GJO01587.1 magnesium transporter [Mycobacterium marinum]GJO07672.1 magnesium transporter [Mycobacterium marinum]GJO11004.1 magnesium transporter [Mycobacterium marinum]GJO19140.1 magnesium transporter [Mycobacterium marinum]GJO27863.1 magnesium transporter [Mycobacterium marinum]
MQVAPSVRGRVWRSGQLQDEFDFDKIAEYLSEENALVWADLCNPDHDTLSDLAEKLRLNHWAVEDAVAAAERVKSTAYVTHTFFTVYDAGVVGRLGEDTAPMLSMRRISAFVLGQGLITVRLTPDFDITEVTRRWDEIGGQQYGVGALVHGLLDVVVDSHFAAVEALDDCIEAIEDELFENNSPRGSFQRRTFQIRRDLVNLRRIALPMREVVNSLQHHRLHVEAARELDPLYADLYDHVLRVSEWTESLRDMISTIFETNLSLQDARLNAVMKKLTGWAAIIAVPTAITGFYGQNVPYPGFGTLAGFLASTSVIVVLMALLYVMFRRRDWL